MKFSIKVAFTEERLCQTMKDVLDAALQQQISRPMRRQIENTSNGQFVTVADLNDMLTAVSKLPEMINNKRDKQNVFDVIEAFTNAKDQLTNMESVAQEAQT